MKRSIIGNQAVAYGALAAGIDVAAGYPGTPSSEALTELLHFSRTADRGGEPSPYVEWSVNEKVAFELATGAAWAGKRALATMKMSGANVAADSILSVAYSGTRGGLVCGCRSLSPGACPLYAASLPQGALAGSADVC